MFSQDRTQLRRFFCEAWRRHLQGLPLEPLEHLVAEVIRRHPEYQPLLEDPQRAVELQAVPEAGITNPFLHMGMHIAIQEQVQADLPPGIRQLHRRLCVGSGGAHTAEHLMMEALAETLWQAHRTGSPPDLGDYLRRLQALSARPAIH